MLSSLIKLLPMLKGLGGLLKNAFLGLLLFNRGVDKEVLKGKEKEVKDAKEAGKIRNNINALSDADLDLGLRKPRDVDK